MRKNWNIGLLATVALVVSASGAWAQGHRTRDFMRDKLSYTQGIVEGITLEKYELVITNAVSLRNMNLTNAFLALKNPEYVSNITNFQARVDSLVNAARAQDLKKSTEEYSRVVSSCVACHKSFRREQFVKGQ